LTRHPEGPEEAVRHAAGVIASSVADSGRRAELLTVLGIFGKLVHPDIHPFDIIGRQLMHESLFVQEIMDEGRKEIRRADTLIVLEERFGAEAAASVTEAVNALEDLQQLDQLHRLAIKCPTVEDFREALSAAAQPQPARRRRGSSRRRPPS
jgi:hypothetical protein